MIKDYILKILENEKILTYLSLVVKNSFIIWIPIIFWITYKGWQEYKNINAVEKRKFMEYSADLKLFHKYSLKLEDIKNSYKTIKNYFPLEKTKEIKNKLDQLIKNLNQSDRKFNEIFPYRINTFNLSYGMTYSRFELPVFSIADIKFKADSTTYFQKYLQDLKKKNKNNIKITGNVQTNLLDDKIVLIFKTDKKGLLELNNIFITGFISNIYVNPFFVTSTVLNKNSLGLNYANFYFGWNMKLKEEGK